MFYYIFILYIIIFNNYCKAFPKEIQKCHFEDNKCIVDVINHIIKKYPKGIPEMGLKPIDVVDIPDAELLKNDVGFFWAAIKLIKQVNYGFENTTITEIAGFAKDPTLDYIIISGRIPSLVHKGVYTGRGRLWFINVDITGESTSEFQNMHFTLKLKVSIEFRNNKRHLKIYELSPTVNIDRWILWMESLFPENTDLTISINRLFNERWVEIWNEWEPVIMDTFAKVFLSMFQETFERIPYDEMFLPDVV